MIRPLPILAALGALAGAPAAAFAQAAPSVPAGDTVLSLSATGEVSAPPDMARLSLSVEVDGPTAAEALRRNAARMTAVIAAVKAAGVGSRDIQTSRLNVQAQYQYDQGKPPRLTGYHAGASVTAAVRDIARVGEVVDAVTSAGANEVSGVAFDIAEPQALEDRARREAVRALQAKAALYAQATGLRVIRLVSLAEGMEAAPVRPTPMMAMAMRKAETPVEAGELKVTVTVNGRFDLGH